MTDNYTILIQKLDEFIRKYYKNRLIRGLIYFVTALLAFFLITNSIEYFANLEPLARTILFYSYILVNLIILYRFVLIPLFKLYRIGKIISHEEASRIIGTHFVNVKDRLLNTLQLKKMQDFNPENAGLIEASINQRIQELKPVPFSAAIDLRQNRKYFRYVFPPLIILLILLIAAPSFITEPTDRLIHHQVYYEKKVPFEIQILNPDLTAVQQEDFQLDIKVSGEEVPDVLYIESGNSRFNLSKENNALWHYHFKNLQKSLTFQIVSEDYKTREYELKVLPKPIVLNFGIDLIYPKYIRKENEKIENTGDLIVPFGTQILWKFYTRDTREMILRIGDQVQKLKQGESNAFTYTTTALKGLNYSVTSFNEFLKNSDSLSFSISVIPDAYPQIDVEEMKDSVFENRLYFRGQVRDDYGLSRLTFNYSILTKDSGERKPDLQVDTLSLSPLVNQQSFYHYFDLMSLKLPEGAGIEYYFEIWDNDGINGSKSARSRKMYLKAPSREELAEKAEKASDKLKDEMEEAQRQARDLKKEIEELNKKLFEKKEINWQEKKQIENLMKKQEALQNKIQQINEDKKLNEQREQQFNEQQERILEKQEQLQNLFEQALSDEMKKMMEDLRKMLEEVDKNKVNDMLEKMEMSAEDLEKQLDRNLELYKQLEFEKRLDDAVERIDELKKEQEKLSEETAKDGNSKEMEKKQEELNKDFDDFAKEMEDIKKLNESMEEPNQMPETAEQQKDIKQEMKSSSENLKNKKNKKASQNQKNAAQKMEQMSQQMKNMQEQMQGESMEEDMGDLREIIENLIQVSFDQESLMGRISKIRTYDPKYVGMIQEQKNLQDNLKMIEDSLFALSKRQASIKPLVNKEINEINDHIEKAITEMTERRVNTAAQKQQYAMTGMNNLALLLQEAMNQMQQQMQQQSSGKGSSSCGKGGKGGEKMSFKKMQSMQEQLGKEMEKMKEKLQQQGNKPKNGGKQGQGQQGEPSMSEQMARMAAQQEAIRKQLQDLRDEMAKEGKGNDGNLNKMIQNMEMNETDIVNKNITNQTLMRQKEILTRLLESEKAMRQREQEERRESVESKVQNFGNPKDFFEYNKIKNRETELLKTVPPSLKPFYKNKVSSYFYNFQE